METQAQQIRSINTPGWDGLDATPQQIVAEPSQLDKSYQRCFATEDGQKVLDHLIGITIDQPAWMPGNDHSVGYSREGQNSIIREIRGRIRRAING